MYYYYYYYYYYFKIIYWRFVCHVLCEHPFIFAERQRDVYHTAPHLMASFWVAFFCKYVEWGWSKQFSISKLGALKESLMSHSQDDN